MHSFDLFSYIVKYDSGFAPNPFGGICTLACCKPVIRRTAQIGDWIIGTTPAPRPGRLVYAMRVGRGLTYDYYFNDPRYENKKPGVDNPRGDNIYSPTNGELQQLPNPAHDERHETGDLSTNRVLISDVFFYFGKEAPTIPKRFQHIVHTTQGHKRIRSRDRGYDKATEFIRWLEGEYKPGIYGEPADEKIMCLPPEEDDTFE